MEKDEQKIMIYPTTLITSNLGFFKRANVKGKYTIIFFEKGYIVEYRKGDYNNTNFLLGVLYNSNLYITKWYRNNFAIKGIKKFLIRGVLSGSSSSFEGFNKEDVEFYLKVKKFYYLEEDRGVKFDNGSI